ncbi:hypothetical protein V8E51_013504 [Hyaloscypha variabilis]
MRLFHIFSLSCAIAEAASTMHFTDSWDSIVAGQPFDLTWEDNIGAVNITLNQGTETNCTAVNIIAANIDSTSFTWTPAPAMPDNKFFFTLTDSTGTTAMGAEFVIATDPSSTTTTPTTPIPASNSSTTTMESATTNSSTTGSSTNSSATSLDPEDKKAHQEELKRMKIGLGVGGSLVILGLIIMPLFIAFLYWQGSTHTHAPHDGPAHVVVGHVV